MSASPTATAAINYRLIGFTLAMFYFMAIFRTRGVRRRRTAVELQVRRLERGRAGRQHGSRSTRMCSCAWRYQIRIRSCSGSDIAPVKRGALRSISVDSPANTLLHPVA